MKASVKYLAIYNHREKYAIQTLCEFFGVSRSGYYGFVKRMDKPEKHLEAVKKYLNVNKQQGRHTVTVE